MQQLVLMMTQCTHIRWGFHIATGHITRITIVIIRGFCMMCNSMDDKQRVYGSIRLFWGPLAHVRVMCTRPFLLLLKGLDTRLVHRVINSRQKKVKFINLHDNKHC